MTPTPVDRHVLVTGGTRGLGQAIVSALLDAGYRVSTLGRSPSPFTDERAARLPDAFAFERCDIASPEDVQRVVDAAVARFGTPWGVINNAGMAGDGVLATVHPSQIDRLLSINLAGTLHVTRRALRAMLLRRDGRIINISSIIGLRGYSGLSVYAATKAGIDGITRSLARELGGRGITVNSVAPGYLETEMTHGLDDGQRDMIVRRTPLGALGTPADVVPLILFLLSDGARFITGQTIAVDGGITC